MKYRIVVKTDNLLENVQYIAHNDDGSFYLTIFPHHGMTNRLHVRIMRKRIQEYFGHNFVIEPHYVIE